MDTPIVPFKQCSNKEKCVQFGQQGWMPATVEYFPKDERYQFGVKSRCRACINGYQKEYRKLPHVKAKAATDNRTPERMEYMRTYQAQPDIIQYRREWLKRPSGKRYVRQRAHNRRAKIVRAGGTHSTDDIVLLLKLSKGRCWWCGKKIKGEHYHLDHRVPLSQGGSNAPENLCISCPKCNLSKSDKLPQDFNGRLL